MSADAVARRKRSLRETARCNPPPETGAEAAQSRLLEQPELAAARTVCLYAATFREVPTERVIDVLLERGLHVVLPRMDGGEALLHPLRARTELRVGYRGIAEPPAEFPVAPAEVDVFVVPGLLFDRAGRRLGQGGGHFDRLLAQAREGALRVGLCYAAQVIEELPEAPWDVAVHRVVTEVETILAGDV